MIVDPNYKIDDRWPNYSEPKTAVARLVQQPFYKINGTALADALMKDWRAERKVT